MCLASRPNGGWAFSILYKRAGSKATILWCHVTLIILGRQVKDSGGEVRGGEANDEKSMYMHAQAVRVQATDSHNHVDHVSSPCR